MQITVDTKHDSHEDIQKVIAMLRHLVGEKDIFTNASGQVSASQEQNAAQTLADMFSSDAQSSGQSSDLQPSIISPEIVQPVEKKMDDLFSDLLSEEDLPEAKQKPEVGEEETPIQKPKIEFY